MHGDGSAESKRRDDSARTPVAAKKNVAATNVPKLIDPERLSKAIRYIKGHPTFPDEADQQRQSVKKAVVDDGSPSRPTAPRAR
jgi:hypothetical protein